jgi:hypothetical protein
MKNHPFQSTGGVSEIRPVAPGFPAQAGWRSNGQALPTLGAASANHRAAAARRHADEKAMSALAMNRRRLIGAFHDETPEIIAN